MNVSALTPRPSIRIVVYYVHILVVCIVVILMLIIYMNHLEMWFLSYRCLQWKCFFWWTFWRVHLSTLEADDSLCLGYLSTQKYANWILLWAFDSDPGTKPFTQTSRHSKVAFCPPFLNLFKIALMFILI